MVHSEAGSMGTLGGTGVVVDGTGAGGAGVVLGGGVIPRGVRTGVLSAASTPPECVSGLCAVQFATTCLVHILDKRMECFEETLCFFHRAHT